MIDIESVDELVLDFVKITMVNNYNDSKVIWGTNDKANLIIESQGSNLKIPMCNLFRSKCFSQLVNKHNFTYILCCRFENQIDSNKATQIFLNSTKKINDKTNIDSIEFDYENNEANISNLKQKFVIVKINFNLTISL